MPMDPAIGTAIGGVITSLAAVYLQGKKSDRVAGAVDSNCEEKLAAMKEEIADLLIEIRELKRKTI